MRVIKCTLMYYRYAATNAFVFIYVLPQVINVSFSPPIKWKRGISFFPHLSIFPCEEMSGTNPILLVQLISSSNGACAGSKGCWQVDTLPTQCVCESELASSPVSKSGLISQLDVWELSIPSQSNQRIEGGCQGVCSLLSKKQTLCDSLGYTATVWKDNDFYCAIIYWEITGKAEKGGGDKNERWERRAKRSRCVPQFLWEPTIMQRREPQEM